MFLLGEIAEKEALLRSAGTNHDDSTNYKDYVIFVAVAFGCLVAMACAKFWCAGAFKKTVSGDVNDTQAPPPYSVSEDPNVVGDLPPPYDEIE